VAPFQVKILQCQVTSFSGEVEVEVDTAVAVAIDSEKGEGMRDRSDECIKETRDARGVSNTDGICA
jgi:hypothetical protein